MFPPGLLTSLAVLLTLSASSPASALVSGLPGARAENSSHIDTAGNTKVTTRGFKMCPLSLSFLVHLGLKLKYKSYLKISCFEVQD